MYRVNLGSGDRRSGSVIWHRVGIDIGGTSTAYARAECVVVVDVRRGVVNDSATSRVRRRVRAARRGADRRSHVGRMLAAIRLTKSGKRQR